MRAALSEVTDVLENYFDALHYSDPDRIEAVFHPKAIYATADEDPLLYRTMGEYLPVIAAREAPHARGETRADHIDSIELAGENTALARVRCSIGNKDFTDFLTLVRTGGEWRIMAKIFQISDRRG